MNEYERAMYSILIEIFPVSALIGLRAFKRIFGKIKVQNWSSIRKGLKKFMIEKSRKYFNENFEFIGYTEKVTIH